MVNRGVSAPRILRLLLLILCGGGHVLCGNNFEKVGGNHTFTPKIPGKLDSILWKLNNDKVVEFEDGIVKWFQFERQGDLKKDTGDLTLKDLTKANSGQYEAEVLVAGKLHTARFTLQVKDVVGHVTISCVVAADGQKTLKCSVDNSVDPVEYIWSGPEGKHTGNIVNVSKDTRPESVYYCTASNEVDKQSNNFSLEECSKSDPVPVAAIVTGVLVTLIIIAVVLAVLCRKKIKTYFLLSNK